MCRYIYQNAFNLNLCVRNPYCGLASSTASICRRDWERFSTVTPETEFIVLHKDTLTWKKGAGIAPLIFQLENNRSSEPFLPEERQPLPKPTVYFTADILHFAKVSLIWLIQMLHFKLVIFDTKPDNYVFTWRKTAFLLASDCYFTLCKNRLAAKTIIWLSFYRFCWHW